MMARDTTEPRKGVSLAKGPVGILGLVGLLYGLSALLFASHGFALHIPHGTAHGKKWIGLEVNGWSELLFIAAGLALLLSAPLHWGAKSMSLLVGAVLLAAAIIAVIRKDGVFGIFAANHLTELIWAAAGVLLLVLALLPRVGGRRQASETTGTGSRPVRGRPTETAAPVAEPRVEEDRARSSQHDQWIEDADEQDRPPRAGARRRDNPNQ